MMNKSKVEMNKWMINHGYAAYIKDHNTPYGAKEPKGKIQVIHIPTKEIIIEYEENNSIDYFSTCYPSCLSHYREQRLKEIGI
jgi:hypothetical protein